MLVNGSLLFGEGLGRQRTDSVWFARAVAAELGIDLAETARRYPHLRELEVATHRGRARRRR